MRTRALLLLTVVVFGTSARASAQDVGRFELGGHVTTAHLSELDTTDIGVSGRFAWYPLQLLGVEVEIGTSPADIPDGRRAISSNRVEGLFGVTVGPRVGPARLYARVRPGFLRVAEAPGPVPCILIFPPPLSCVLAEGHTLFVTDVGGGVTFDVTPRWFIRGDIGDRLVRYPGPAFTRDRDVELESFIDHDLRMAIGGGWRF